MLMLRNSNTNVVQG